MKYIIYFLLFCYGPAAGQSNAVIRGKVMDERGKAPLEQVTVHIPEANVSTKTGSDGQFEFKKLAQDRYTLQFSHLGYKPAERTITLSGTDIYLNVSLTATSTYCNAGRSQHPLSF